MLGFFLQMYHFRYILKNEHNTNVNIQSEKTKDVLKYESYQHIPHRLRKHTHASLFMPYVQKNMKKETI